VKEVVGLFEDHAQAERAADALFERGYDADSVGYLNRHRDAAGKVVLDDGYEMADTAEEAGKGVAGGAAGGAAVGAGAALLTSAGLLLVPGVGPFLAAGTLAGTLVSAAAGAAGGAVLGGAAGAVVGATDSDDGVADETASYYRDRIDTGYAMVSVNVEDSQRDEVVGILNAAGAHRVDSYGDGNWH